MAEPLNLLWHHDIRLQSKCWGDDWSTQEFHFGDEDKHKHLMYFDTDVFGFDRESSPKKCSKKCMYLRSLDKKSWYVNFIEGEKSRMIFCYPTWPYKYTHIWGCQNPLTFGQIDLFIFVQGSLNPSWKPLWTSVYAGPNVHTSYISPPIFPALPLQEVKRLVKRNFQRNAWSFTEVKQLLGSHGQSLEQLKQMSDELQRDEKSVLLSKKTERFRIRLNHLSRFFWFFALVLNRSGRLIVQMLFF